MTVTQDIRYVGVNDRKIDLFEGQYVVPNGMSYNSYVVFDEKTAVFDTVDAAFGDEWLQNVQETLHDRAPAYLIIQHMEPDHSANIDRFARHYPEAVIVATDKAFAMMKKFFGTDYADRRVVVKDGDTLSLGNHLLQFVTAPMVHWPEVMLTYDATDRVLFSADAFGKFGTVDADEPWVDEARRYYIGIVGKYGVQVQNLFKKVGGIDIRMICPLHGPVLTDNLGYYLDLYHTWSTYAPETQGVAVFYTSVYGNTKHAALTLVKELENGGCPNVVVHDLARCDKAAAVADAFRMSKIVLATTSYNGEIFPFMREFLSELTERGFKNRTVGMIENGSWMPIAAKTMKRMLEASKDLTFTDTTVTIHSAVTAENEAQIKALAAELL